MTVQGRAGQGIVQDGAEATFRMGRNMSQAVMDGHGHWYDSVVRGNCFVASLSGAVALGTALTATAVTLTLFNPLSSGRYLVVNQATIAVPNASSSGFVVYAVNDVQGQAAPTGTTPAMTRNLLLGGGTSAIGKAYTACTLPAVPIPIRILAGVVSTLPAGVHNIVDNIDGGIILSPGTMLTIQGVTTNAAGIVSLSWEEVLP